MKTAKFLGAWVVILSVVAAGAAAVFYGGRYLVGLFSAGTTMTRPDDSTNGGPGGKPSASEQPENSSDAWGEWARGTANQWGDWLMGKL